MSESYFEVDEMKYESNVYKSDNVLKRYKEDNKLNYPLIYLKIDAIELFRVDALKVKILKDTIKILCLFKKFCDIKNVNNIINSIYRLYSK